jgi:hypothetical protein
VAAAETEDFAADLARRLAGVALPLALTLALASAVDPVLGLGDRLLAVERSQTDGERRGGKRALQQPTTTAGPGKRFRELIKAHVVHDSFSHRENRPCRGRSQSSNLSACAAGVHIIARCCGAVNKQIDELTIFSTQAVSYRRERRGWQQSARDLRTT